MISPKRYLLLRGPYPAPKCRVGRKLFCLYRRREVVVSGLTDAPISWPFTKKTGPTSLILCGELVRAVRTESESGVAAHWGVSIATVYKWRKALAVPCFTEGTRQLYQDTIPDRVNLETLAAARKLSATPAARAKMSATRKGRPAHPHLKKAALEAARRPKSESFKKLMSERMKNEWAEGKRQPHPPGRPWSDGEIARLGRDTDQAIGQELGRTAAAVRKVRLRLAIPCFVSRAEIHG
jgi:hypothetical protein